MKRSLEEYILITLSFGGAIAISPFALIRLYNADWFIGVVDCILVIGMFLIGLYVYISQQVKFASYVLIILSLAGAVAVVYIKGDSVLYWIYPTIVAVFYLIPPSTSALLTLIAIAALSPALSRQMQAIPFIASMMTLIVTIVFAYVFSNQMNKQREQLSLLVRKDPLTGTGNRRAMEESIHEFVHSQSRTSMTASLIMLDIDHFKNINDIYGHIVGDQVLTKLVEIISGRIRISDKLYRFGGEEFVIVAVGTTLQSAKVLAEDLRILTELATLLPETLTISVGVAEYQVGESEDNWLNRCDNALYHAKHQGRNLVVLAENPKIDTLVETGSG